MDRNPQNDIRLRLGSRSDVRLWRQNTGVGLSMDGERVMSFGVKGGGDESGIIAPWGIRLEVEVKTGTGRQHRAQRNFQAMIERFGGIYIVAHDPDEAEALLEQRIAQLRGRFP